MLAAALVAAGVGFAPATAAFAAPHVDTPAAHVTAVDAAEETQAAAAAPIPTTTTLGEFSTPTVYGRSLVVTGTVTLDGPALLMGAPIYLEVDGEVVGEGFLIYIGSGAYWALIPAQHLVSAGTHEVVVKFPGYSPGFPFDDAAPSESAPFAVTIAQAATTTTITSAPASAVAFTPVDVAGQVTADPAGVSGSAALLADGDSIATADLSADGSVLFEDAVVPFGTAELAVAYLGDAAGNYATSQSTASPIVIAEAETSTDLALSDSHVRAGDPVTFTATVRNISAANLADPRSGIEFLVDGEVVFAEVNADEPDAAPGDGETTFEVTLSDTLLGEHQVTARFLPSPGFGASESDPVELQVDGIDTVMAPKLSQLSGTIEHPVVVEVEVTALTAAPAVNGTVQAFLGEEPLGESFPVENGIGSGPISGLEIGTHQVDLRFVPGTYGLVGSSAAIVVTVDASPAPEPRPVPKPDPTPKVDPTPSAGGETAGLSATGGAEAPGLMLAALTLVLGAGSLMLIARRHRNA